MKRYRQRALEHYDRILGITQGASEREGRLLRRVYRRNWLPHLPADRNAACLDLGCGFGTFLDFLATEGYADIQGVDLCEANVQTCRRKGHRVTQGDLLSFLEETAASYAFINMSHVLEHFDKEEGLALLEAAHRRLRPGGVLALAVPNAGAPFVGGRQRYADITHETGFTQESLGAFLQIAGFISCRVLPIDVWVLPNPLVNLGARIVGLVLFACLRALFLLHGIRTTTIFTKNLLALGRKHA